MLWADKFRTLKVRTNADTPEDANARDSAPKASASAAPSTCSSARRPHPRRMREMILAETRGTREEALAKLLPYQRDDFVGIFKAMKGLPGHHPPARSAAARVPAAQREGPGRAGPKLRRTGGEDHVRASSSCTSSTRCSATAAAASASPIRRSPPCRRARSSRPRPSARRKASRSKPEIMIPLVGFKKELDLQKRSSTSRARRSSREEGEASTTWSAR